LVVFRQKSEEGEKEISVFGLPPNKYSEKKKVGK